MAPAAESATPVGDESPGQIPDVDGEQAPTTADEPDTDVPAEGVRS